MLLDGVTSDGAYLATILVDGVFAGCDPLRRQRHDGLRARPPCGAAHRRRPAVAHAGAVAFMSIAAFMALRAFWGIVVSRL